MKTEAKDKKILQWNIAITILCQIMSLLINMLSKRSIKIYLGLEYLGLQSVYSNFCDVMSFAFLGMGTTMLFSCYGPLARKDYAKVAAVYRCYDYLYKKVAKIVVLIAVCSIAAVVLLTNSNISVREIVITYSCFMLSVIIYNRFLFQNYFIESNEKRYMVAFVTNFIDAIALIVQILCLKYFGSYLIFVLCIFVKNIAIFTIFKFYLKRNYGYLKDQGKELPHQELTAIHKNAKNMMIYRFGNVLIANTDSIFISKFINTIMVGVYSNYQFVVTGINSLVAAFFGAMTATIGRFVQTSKKEKQFNNFVLCSLVNIWISGFTTVCFFYLVEDFIKLWMGDVKLLSTNILIIILVNYYVIACRYATRLYRESTGMFDKIQTVVLMKGVLNIILSYILGKRWGLTGILIATTIASVVTLFWYEAKLVYEYFHKSFFCEIIYQFFSVVLMLLSLSLTGFACSFLKGYGFLSFIIKVFVCIVASNFIYFIVAAILLCLFRKKLFE